VRISKEVGGAKAERGAAVEGDEGVVGMAGPTADGRGGGAEAVGEPRVPTHAEVCTRALHLAARSGRRLGVLTSAVAARNPTHTAVRGVNAVDASTTTHAEVRAATTAAAARTQAATSAAAARTRAATTAAAARTRATSAARDRSASGVASVVPVSAG